MPPPIRCAVVDDNEIDRLTIAALLETYPGVEICGIYNHPETALTAIRANPPDALFLDIDMPGFSGLALRERLMDIPV